MNPDNSITQSETEASSTTSQQFPMFATDPNFVTPQRRQLRPLPHQFSGFGEEHVNATTTPANAPRKAKRPLESCSSQDTSEESMQLDSNSPPLKRTPGVSGITNNQSYKLTLESPSRLAARKAEISKTAPRCSHDASKNISRDPKPRQSLDFNSTEDSFKLKEDCLGAVKKFISCTDCRPWNNPVKFRPMKETDDPSTYQIHKKSHENRPPKIVSVLINIIPSILRRRANKNHGMPADFTESHCEIIEKLSALIHCNGSRWEGIYAFLPWPNMNFTRYCLDTKKPIHPSLNFIEAYRRILKMESACAELVKFLSTTIGGARKLLRRIAPKHLADAYAVLISEDESDILQSIETSLTITGVEKSNGSDIAQLSTSEILPVNLPPTESNADIAKCISSILPSACTVISPIAEKCKWLKNNRR